MDGVVYSDGFGSADFLKNFPERFNRFGTAVLWNLGGIVEADQGIEVVFLLDVNFG